MPLSWKPWLIGLLMANMVVPLFLMADHVEARVVFGAALLCGACFVVLTAYGGFSRLLGLGHLPWIPLILYLVTRLDQAPAETFFGVWLRTVIVLDLGSLGLDVANVIRYLAGQREEVVTHLSKKTPRVSDPATRTSAEGQ
jgi:hypothetical protein